VAGVVVGSGADGEPDRQGRPSLSLREQVGQVLISSFDGPGVPAYLRRRLRAGDTAGVILFPENARSRGATRAVTRAIRRRARHGALVMADQEGGVVRTLLFAGPVPGEPAQVGPRTTGALARRAGRQLRRAGVNVNLAPVADLPGGPALRNRTFRGTPGQVGAKVAAAVRGYGERRVAATAKHFPGLGAARINTDQAPVTLPLRQADLTPFRAAIRADVPLVMSSHALYPSVDRHRIASQSAPVTALLRRRLGFRGVIVTDSIEARSVLSRSGVAVAAERSISAGADLVLMTGSASWKLVFPRLLRKARRSASFRHRIEASAGRVLELKRRLGIRGA
jgi:beta-N-acetylhexosaminidase